MNIRRRITLLLACVMLLGVFTQIPLTAFAAKITVRDTVLILDDSGSMEGEPMNKLVDSAEKFCESVLGFSGTNRVAIITYSTGAELKCDFTNNMSVLQTAINDMDEYGMTNIYDALSIANDLLGKSSANVKNIVLMSDGLPNEGSTVISGRYDYSDYEGYDYANAVYNQAISYHPNYYIYTLGFFHNIYGDTKAFASRFMEDLQNAGYYEVDKVEDLEFTFGEIAEDITETKVTGTFKYPNGAKDYSATYYYADEYFYNTSMEYNQSLATMSLCLAMSAFGSGEVSSYENKRVNVKNLMEELMFTDFETTKSFTEKPTADSIAAAISQKRVRDDNEEVYTLLAVAVRGGGYEQEWASNFTIGADGNHTGFSDAANQVIDFIKGYISDHEIEGDIKLWITGYSRAAATSNLVAGKLDAGTSLGDTVTLAQKDLYAYCFETPAGTTDSDANSKTKYGNIYNIINPNDLVTKVAPTAMGFRRYGIDRVLPTEENKYNSYSKDTEAMLKQYNALESTGEYELNKFVFKKVDLTHIIPGGKEVVYESEEQISMSAFLDDLLAKLVYGYVGRSFYNSNVEDGVRELCKALFQDESKASAVLDSTVKRIKDDAVGIIWKFLWDEYGAYEKIAGYLTDSLKENGASNFSDKEIQEAAQPLLDVVIACLANNIHHFVTIIDNASYFFPAHYPELCLAWMQSMDVNYTTDAGEAFSSGSYRIIRINCPVDVNVYDMQGTLVASIVGNKAQKLGTSSIKSLINSDGEKVVYLPADAEFKIDITGTDNGAVTYSVNEFSYEVGQVNRLVNYYDVPIEKGRTLNAVVPAYDITYLSNGTANGTNTKYQLTDMDGNVLTPDLAASGTAAINAYHAVTAVSENEDHGTVTGSGVRQTGNYAQVVAVAKDGYVFEGWYVNEQKVSTEVEYRFCVKDDITLIAKFTHNTPVSSDGLKDDDGGKGLMIGIVASLVLLLVGGGIVAAFVFTKKCNADSDKDSELDIQQNLRMNIVMCQKCGTAHPSDKPCNCWIEENKDQITEETEQKTGSIQIISGSMNGFAAPIRDGETLCLGKDPKFANIVFAGNYEKVSRMHCTITYDAAKKQYYVVDCSSNGTFLAGKVRMEKGKRTVVTPKTVITLANGNCTILLG